MDLILLRQLLFLPNFVRGSVGFEETAKVLASSEPKFAGTEYFESARFEHKTFSVLAASILSILFCMAKLGNKVESDFRNAKH